MAKFAAKSLLEISFDPFSGALFLATLYIVDKKKVLEVDSFPFLEKGSDAMARAQPGGDIVKGDEGRSLRSSSDSVPDLSPRSIVCRGKDPG